VSEKSTKLRLLAPGKINLCLLLGPQRSDGYHELASVFLPLDLSDQLLLETAPVGVSGDSVRCEGVEGDNLAAKAIASWRDHSGWAGPAVNLTIKKMIPVAAGMGGGSADAAAALRLVAAAAGRENDSLLDEIAPMLGADVPAMLHGGPLLGEGVGSRMTALSMPADAGYLIIPSDHQLSTATVFAKAGEMGLRRDIDQLASMAARVVDICDQPGWVLPDDLLGLNDLTAAALELQPSIADALNDVLSVGATKSFMTGSGPTVVGIFDGPDGLDRAAQAAAAISERWPRAVACAASPRSATIERFQ